MIVLGRDKLIAFYKKHAQAKGALDAWFDEAKMANWQSPHDVKKRYSSADPISKSRVIFNIKGNHYRLVVEIKYQKGIAYIEWVGTHSEYDKKRF